MSKKNNQNLVSQELLQELISQAEGQDLFGKDGFFQQLKKDLVNGILDGEMDYHLGYAKHDKSAKDNPNRRNGHYSKTVTSGEEQLELSIPRDRTGDFEPQLIKKGVRRFDGFDEKVISMYARGMTMAEIKEHILEIYGTPVSTELISNITDKVIEDVTAWQNRALEEVYPVVYLDCIHVKARDNHTIINKAVYLALAINLEGKKELLGMWISKNEGAKFWMQVITELKNRGVKDILIACVDGLKGFSEAINSVFPETIVQLCIVHMVRNSMKFVPWKDRKSVAADLKAIYTAANEEQALDNLQKFKEKWDSKYPTIADIWERNWTGIMPCLAMPEDIRQAVYTTNMIESINSQVRKIIKNKGVFPNDTAIKKSIFLALQNAAKKWTMPIRNWRQALNQFAILFDNRINL